VIWSPAAAYELVSDVLVRLRLEVELDADTVTEELFEVTVALCGFVPDAVAEFVTEPASTSAWSTV